MEKDIDTPGGYTGNILRVDLTSERVTVEPLDYGEARAFHWRTWLGGQDIV